MNTCLTCFSIALAEMPSSSPMPVLERPSAISVEHLELARGQLGERAAVVAAAEQLGDDLRVHRRAAARHALERLGELAHVGDAVLEQVADAALLAGQQVAGVALLDVLGEDQHRRAGHALARLDRRAHALVGEAGREPDVDEREVGLVLDDRLDERRPGVDGGDDLPPAVAQQAGEALAQEGQVFGDDDAHGSSARIVVPSSPDCTASRPSSASTRWRRPVRPEPLALAPPRRRR